MNLIQLYPSASYDDLRLYFNNTLVYAKVPDSKSFELLYVAEIQAGPTGINLYLSTLDGKTPAKPHDIKKVEVEIRYPEAGYLNWRSTVVWISRRSMRQNQKGISSNTVGISNPFYDVIRQPIRHSPAFKLLDKYSFPQHGRPDIFHALRSMLVSEEPVSKIGDSWNRLSIPKHALVARAISRKFALSKGVETQYPSLWFDGSLVGYMPSPRKITMGSGDAQMFYQEVADCFIPQGIEVSSY